MSSKIPEGYFYTKKHEWAREEGGLLVVGITDFAQNALGDVVYVDLKPADTKLDAGSEFGAIESVKAAEDLYSPVAGTIAEVNRTLNGGPEQVNRDPYGAWMIKIRDYDSASLQKLMTAGAYREYTDSLG